MPNNITGSGSRLKSRFDQLILPGFEGIPIKWLVVILLLFLAISFLYYLAPAKRSDFKFISPGSTLATLLFVLTSLGFSAYVNNFGQYNKLYGWIGTLMVILIWLYLNSIALLIGFELNVSIKEAIEENIDKNHVADHNEEAVLQYLHSRIQGLIIKPKSHFPA